MIFCGDHGGMNFLSASLRNGSRMVLAEFSCGSTKISVPLSQSASKAGPFAFTLGFHLYVVTRPWKNDSGAPRSHNVSTTLRSNALRPRRRGRNLSRGDARRPIGKHGYSRSYPN